MNSSMFGSTDACYAAVLARDPRFDGKFFIGVTTTGVYCRPICPARPHLENIVCFDSAHAAEQAGYRPCLRCRPEAAPLSPAWYGTSALVQRALRRILEVGLCNETEEAFAAHFGVTARHLRRLFTKELGKTPKQVYQEQRLALSRKLLVDTCLPVTEIAYAAGFQSIRRFNDAFQQRFFRAPTHFRKDKSLPSDVKQITLRLSYRPPFHWHALLQHLKKYQLPEVELITEVDYTRYYKTSQGVGQVRATNDVSTSALAVTFEGFDIQDLYTMLQRVRRLFDLDADPLLIANALEPSPVLHQRNENTPGVRAPGAWDAFETAVMIILGHQASLGATHTWAKQLMAHYGECFTHQNKTIFLFPTPCVLATANFDQTTLPCEKQTTITALSQHIHTGRIQLRLHQNINHLQEQLLAIPGMNPWCVDSIIMRCLGHPDGFPVSDPLLQNLQQSNPALHVEKVAPWRSYAAHLLWTTQEQPNSSLSITEKMQ